MKDSDSYGCTEWCNLDRPHDGPCLRDTPSSVTHYVERHDRHVWEAPSGMAIGELVDLVGQARLAAAQYMLPGRHPMESLPDDWARVEARGGKIRVWFEVTS